MIPYGKQCISKDDIEAVVSVLDSDFLTTGPMVGEFEKQLAEFSEVEYAVAVSNGTAALHCAVFAAGIQAGDEVIVSAMTFAASANCVVYMGGIPVFADSLADSLLIDPEDVRRKMTRKTKAVIAVDYAGQPCDYKALRQICSEHGLVLITDACHSIGSEFQGQKTGSIADITCYSFHPVKHITTGEGGAAVTNNIEYAEKMRVFRNHGITTDFRQRENKGAHFYEMSFLGYNYRLTDFQSALGISQLKKLPGWLRRRNEIADLYFKKFNNDSRVQPLQVKRDLFHSYHLFVVRLSDFFDRDVIFKKMRDAGIGVNVHYIPVHLHPFYRDKFATSEGLCPVAEDAYKRILSLPMFPGLKDSEVDFVSETLYSFLDK